MSAVRKKPQTESHGPLSTQQLESVAQLFCALAEPSRLRILQVLQTGPASVSQIIQQTGFKQANVSKQLGLLTTAGITERERAGTQVIYKIRLPLVFDLCGLVCQGMAQHTADLAAVWKR